MTLKLGKTRKISQILDSHAIYVVSAELIL